MKSVKHFLTTIDYSQYEINHIVKLGLSAKKDGVKKTLSDKILAMLFFNPSLRTRLSLASDMYKLGGIAIDLPADSSRGQTFEFLENAVMNKGKIEHIKEVAPVISRYFDSLAIRASNLVTSSENSVNVSSWEELKKDTILYSFAKYSTVPVINLESNVWHPCQGLGDAVTLV